MYLNKHSLDFKMRRRVRPPLNPDLSPPGYKIHKSRCKNNILVKAFFHFSFVLKIILVFFHKSGLTLIAKNDARSRELFFYPEQASLPRGGFYELPYKRLLGKAMNSLALTFR